MKYSYFYIFILAGLFPGVLLPAAAESVKPGLRSLRELCIEAAAYRSAQPSENLYLDDGNTTIAMAADITAHSNPYFTLEHSKLIQRSVYKLSAKHCDIMQHFIRNNDGYQIHSPRLSPIAKSTSEEIAERLPAIMDRLNSNTLTVPDYNFLLKNRQYIDFPDNYLAHIERLTHLLTKVETHFNRLCENNIYDHAKDYFEKQKKALSTTLENAISLTNQRMNDLTTYSECIRNICTEHNILQKRRALQEEQAAQAAIRRVDEQREREAQAAEQERQRAARTATRVLLRLAIPTTLLAVAGSAYLQDLRIKFKVLI